MQASEIRNRFVEFFKKNDHLHLESSSLVPEKDPTLLFANAGMNQFKDYFTGTASPNHRRAVTTQKCVRAGGKHNDLENVGFTARHHTFFEMLGNFSFGDYFKKDAINFAWKFLTEELKIPKDKLYVTVHYSDDEAAEIWEKEQNIAPERIFKRGDKDNFWEMGDIGPCGPCSEIFFDHGPKHTDPNFIKTDDNQILDDELRYVEVWNLVFMQYEKYKENGEIKRKALPRPSVDTGAGLERIAAVLQGKYWNYDTDLFAPIIAQIEKLTSKKYDDPKYQSSIRVVADHIRSSVMLITDGVIPSNEGRGYVLRRIIRRAIRHLRDMGLKDVSFYKLIPSVFEVLGSSYPQNQKNVALAEKMLRLEEKKFLETLEIGLKYLEEEIQNTKGKIFDGKSAFKLYDTYGFPLDLTEVILKERQLELDMQGFETEMEEQRKKSRSQSKFEAEGDNKKLFYDLQQQFGNTKFLGYDNFSSSAKLLKKVELGKNQTCLIFDQSPCYAESGGQAGDQGSILLNGNTLATISDTQKPVEGLFVHMVNNADSLEEGEEYTLQIDVGNRQRSMKNHTATHLLQAALIKTLGAHVKQSGSSVGPDRLRFDFTHPEAMTRDEIKKVEKIVNEKIRANIAVGAVIVPKEKAETMGAMALFGEKYGDEVRVITVGHETDIHSRELCGGTHVKNTAEIQYFSIIQETALASGIRRIEALTEEAALARLEMRSDLFAQVEKSFSVKEEKVLKRLEGLQQDLKDKSKEIQDLKDEIQSSHTKGLFDQIEELPNKLLFKEVALAGDLDLRKLSDSFTDKYPTGTLVLKCEHEGKISVLVRTGKNNKQVNCSQLFKENIGLLEGRGGGRPDFAQGSASNSQKWSEFVAQIKKQIGELV